MKEIVEHEEKVMIYFVMAIIVSLVICPLSEYIMVSIFHFETITWFIVSVCLSTILALLLGNLIIKAKERCKN